MKPKPLPKIDRLNELLFYNDETGELTWKDRPTEHFKTLDAHTRWKKLKAGRVAGSQHKSGYVAIEIDKSTYKAHRLAWKIYYGSDPSGDIDHINHVRNDNRISNLRTLNASD